MNVSEFKTLAASGSIGDVVIYGHQTPTGETKYEIWAYDHQDVIDSNDRNIVGHFGNRLNSARGAMRLYANIDRAVAAVREWGYHSKITVDGYGAPLPETITKH